MTYRPGSVLVFACLLVAAVVPAAAVSADQSAVTVESVGYGGEEFGTPTEEAIRVWQSNDHEFLVEIRSNVSVPDATVCIRSDVSDGNRQLGCEAVALSPGDDRTVSVTVDPWPEDLTGERSIEAVVRNETTNETLGTASLVLRVFERNGDIDEDGLPNEAELEHGTDMDDRDTDDDRLSDAAEVRTYDTSPTDPDSDSDGIEDGTEINRHHTDPTETDTDGDGLSDGREIELGTIPTRADTDGDGLADGPEVNRYQTNTTAVDTDGDGLTDAAEVNEFETNPTVSDTDGDGLTDGEEGTLYDTDPTRTDTDGDSLEDAAEVREHYTDPTEADTDDDGLEDASEIRDHETDPLAADTDRDGVDDGTERELGSDPLDPGDTAEPGLAYRTRTTVEERPLLFGAAGLLAMTVSAVLVARHYGWTVSPGLLARGHARTDDQETPADPTEPDSDEGPNGDELDGTSGMRAGVTGSSLEPGPENAVPIDSSILTNEERVQRLLEEHNGRMLQSDIVEASDWSKATVSRVLSRMEEDGAVSRVDIGKGNLVARPGDEPANANSPFSE